MTARRSLNRICLASLVLCAACERQTGHSHDDHGHDEHGHNDHASGEHAHNEHGHDEHSDHGHGGHGEAALSFTHYTDSAELFMEVTPLVVGKPSTALIHVTRLTDFSPLQSGSARLDLGSAGNASSDAIARPGIFELQLTPKVAGSMPLRVELEGQGFSSVHALGEVVVHGDEAAAHAVAPEPEPPGTTISFLKEQQWSTEFATAPAEEGELHSSFEAYGTIRARAGGEALVTPPVAGRVQLAEDFPQVGDRVEQNALLATLTPRLSDQGDFAALQQASLQAKIAVNQARSERERLEGLLEKGAIPERRVTEARFEEQQAEAGLKAARLRLGQANRLQGTRGRGGFEVRSPIAGTIVEVVAPGSFVEQSDRMFRIVDLERLWLEVHVAESHVSLLTHPSGVWFEVEGFSQPFEAGAKQIIAVGGLLDPHSRTLPLFVAFDNPEQRLRVGMFAQVHVLTGEQRRALSIPRSAVLDESALSVVYVQKEGESFERRIVKLGIVDGDRIEIVRGLAAGERVVSRGAYAVRLAASVTDIPAHGHHH